MANSGAIGHVDFARGPLRTRSEGRNFPGESVSARIESAHCIFARARSGRVVGNQETDNAFVPAGIISRHSATSGITESSQNPEKDQRCDIGSWATAVFEFQKPRSAP